MIAGLQGSTAIPRAMVPLCPYGTPGGLMSFQRPGVRAGAPPARPLLTPPLHVPLTRPPPSATLPPPDPEAPAAPPWPAAAFEPPALPVVSGCVVAPSVPSGAVDPGEPGGAGSPLSALHLVIETATHSHVAACTRRGLLMFHHSLAGRGSQQQEQIATLGTGSRSILLLLGVYINGAGPSEKGSAREAGAGARAFPSQLARPPHSRGRPRVQRAQDQRLAVAVRRLVASDSPRAQCHDLRV